MLDIRNIGCPYHSFNRKRTMQDIQEYNTHPISERSFPPKIKEFSRIQTLILYFIVIWYLMMPFTKSFSLGKFGQIDLNLSN